MTSLAKDEPVKGYFSSHAEPLESPVKSVSSTPQATEIGYNKTSTEHDDASLAGSVPSSVPKSGRRRESVSSQMRKLVADSPAMAAAGGGLTFNRSTGQTISPRLSSKDGNGLSASLGSVGEILSASHKTVSGEHVRPERRGHTHFGQECFGPGGAGYRRGSVSSVATDDDARSSNGQGLHRCEACSKVYRHPSCLIKHRWEHTVYWKEASKLLMSKHQQVQLLEAAAILVGMDTESRSLPEEKAFWPAAVSPPSSGLLGSDKVNFDVLLASKAARKSMSPMIERKESDRSDHRASHVSHASSLPTHAASLSPLNNFSSLNLGRYSRHGEVKLDESAERSMREESLDTEGGDEDDGFDDNGEGDESMTGSTSISTGSPSRETEDRERYGVGAGGDVLAEMEMEGVE